VYIYTFNQKNRKVNFGWGIRGASISGINHRLRCLGLKNEEPLRFAKLSELISPYPVTVTGNREEVNEFEKYMKLMGYDDR